MPETPLFSHQVHFTEDLYVALWRGAKSTKRWRLLFSQIVLASVALGLSSLSDYTIGLGIAVALALLTLGSFGFFPPPALRKTYQGLRCFRDPISFSVDRTHLSLRSVHLEASVTWDLLVTWQIVGDWLVLNPSGIPHLYVPIERMKQLGIFDEIMTLAKQHGKEFV